MAETISFDIILPEFRPSRNLIRKWDKLVHPHFHQAVSNWGNVRHYFEISQFKSWEAAKAKFISSLKVISDDLEVHKDTKCDARELIERAKV